MIRIINQTGFNGEEKERMLTTFAIFRYSSSFWVNINSQKASFRMRDLMVAVADAIAEYSAANCTNGVNCDDFQDGKDIYQYSGLMSSVAYYIYYFW